MYTEKKVYRAGTIPYMVNNGVVHMMFMKPSDTMYGGDQMQIAKGRVEDGEDNRTAAIREAREELGLLMSNVTSVHEVGNFMGRTTVYVAKIKDINRFGEPSSETAETSWMTMDEFVANGRPLHVPVVRAAYEYIHDIEML